MRTKAEIRDDIIEASKNYKIVSEVAWGIMPDADTVILGTDEVIADMKEQLAVLYKEMFAACKAEKEDDCSS